MVEGTAVAVVWQRSYFHTGWWVSTGTRGREEGGGSQSPPSAFSPRQKMRPYEALFFLLNFFSISCLFPLRFFDWAILFRAAGRLHGPLGRRLFSLLSCLLDVHKYVNTDEQEADASYFRLIKGLWAAARSEHLAWVKSHVDNVPRVCLILCYRESKGIVCIVTNILCSPTLERCVKMKNYCGEGGGWVSWNWRTS